MNNAQLVRDFSEVRLRMLKFYRFAGHIFKPGSVVTVPACEALVMLRGGFAVRIEPERAVEQANERRLK